MALSWVEYNDIYSLSTLTSNSLLLKLPTAHLKNSFLQQPMTSLIAILSVVLNTTQESGISGHDIYCY